jgi:hypothetical protein
MSALTIGGSQTGGTSKTLTPAGIDASGRYRFAFPEHAALSQRLMTVGVKSQPVTKDSLGSQEASIDFVLSEAAPSEGCCTVQQGGVYINLKMRYNLNQPESLWLTAIQYLQGAAFAGFLEGLLTKGVVDIDAE